MSRVRSLVAGGAALAVLALAPAIARADGPLITDPEGDASPLAVCVSGVPVDNCSTPRPLSDPSIDIVTGDIATSGNRLAWSLTVVDLEAPAPHYAMHAMAGDLGITVALNSGTSSVQVWKTHVGWASAEADVVLDAATDTVTWSVPIATIEALRAQACAACAAVGRGTVLHSPRADAFIGTGRGDAAYGNGTYTIGD